MLSARLRIAIHIHFGRFRMMDIRGTVATLNKCCWVTKKFLLNITG